MTTPPPCPPAERFATLILWLSKAVSAQTGWGMSLQLIALITDRLRRIKQRFADVAARVAAGTYSPRRPSAAPRKRPGQSPPPQNRLPQKFGWLLPLEAQAVVYRSQLEHLLREPEVAALLAAAPAAMRRPVRALCWMLDLTPPPVLALPARPRPPRPPAAKPAAPSPSDCRPRTRLGFYKGPPPMLGSHPPASRPPRKIPRKISG
jgi:hypothetical protein